MFLFVSMFFAIKMIRELRIISPFYRGKQLASSENSNSDKSPNNVDNNEIVDAVY